MTVAEIIREQIGGKALYMLGAKDLVADEDLLKFRIMRNAKGVTHIVVRLMGDDTYTVYFYKIRGAKTALLSEVSDVYVDRLCRTIELGTELYTSL